MFLDIEKLKENYLYEGDDQLTSLVGKIIVSQLADKEASVICQQKVLKTDPLVWDGEFEVIIYACGGVILVAVDQGFPEYLHGQLSDTIQRSLLERNTNMWESYSNILNYGIQGTTARAIPYYSNNSTTTSCSTQFTTTSLSQ